MGASLDSVQYICFRYHDWKNPCQITELAKPRHELQPFHPLFNGSGAFSLTRLRGTNKVTRVFISVNYPVILVR